jgi:hypothetical protein
MLKKDLHRTEDKKDMVHCAEGLNPRTNPI